MRNFFGMILLALLVWGCGETDSGTKMELTGKVDGLRKGKLFLEKLEDTLFIAVDSMEIDGNSDFNFSEEIKSPEIYYLTLKFDDSSTIQQRIPFFAENKSIEILANLENYETDAQITGSANQDKLNEYRSLVKRYNDQNLELIESSLNAMKDGNDSLMSDIQGKQERLLVNKYLATVNFAMNQKEYEVAPYLMLTEVFDANIKYLDTVYKSLDPKIKDSRYGKALESYIDARTKTN